MSETEIQALRDAQRTHDSVAIGLMKEAQKHLRESCAIERQLERIEGAPHQPAIQPRGTQQ